jgi:hypothetical protein
MLQYQYQAEREAWVRYIRTIEEYVFETFGANISGDLSLLHQPIAVALRIYNAAFEESRRAEPKTMKQLLAVKEEGLSDPATAEISAVQQAAATESLEVFMRYADAAQAQMKLLIEPQISQQRFKSIHWDTGGVRERPTCIPSALFVVDPGLKSADAVMAQAYHLHRGRLNRSTNTARLKLVFADCGNLLQGLATLRDVFEVVGLINGFANPTPMGMRALYLIVKVRLELTADIDRMGNETSLPTTFLAQLQLQLLRYDKAQEEAAPQDQLFMERLPAVCHQLDPKDQPFVQEMIAELMKTFRPTSSTARSSSRSRCCYWCCFRRRSWPVNVNSAVGSIGNIESGGGDSAIKSGRKAFTSAVRMPAQVGRAANGARPAIVRRSAAAESDGSSTEGLQEPLLNNAEDVQKEGVEQVEQVEQRRVLRGAYRTVEEPLVGWTAENKVEVMGVVAVEVEDAEREKEHRGGPGEEREGKYHSTEEGAERRQSMDVYQQHSAAADTVWYDLRWVLEFEQSKQLLSQDLLVLIKTLAASIALFFVTREGQLLQCQAVSYSAHEQRDCQLSSGAVELHSQITNATLSYGEVRQQCNPHLDLSFLDQAFKALITTNVIVFAGFIGTTHTLHSYCTHSYSTLILHTLILYTHTAHTHTLHSYSTLILHTLILQTQASATPQTAAGTLFMDQSGSEPTPCK